MISLTPTGSPAETASAYDLLAIIANPDAAKTRLDALVAEKTISLEAMENARKLAAEAKATGADAAKKHAAAKAISEDFNANNEVRTRQLDERHEFLVAKDNRLTKYEADVAAREAALAGPLAEREKAVAAKEAALTTRETDLQAREAEAAKLKDALDTRAAKIREAVS